MKIDLIVIGKLKDQNFENIENEFLKRINKFDFKIHELKSSSENQQQEAELILKKLDDLTKKQSAKVYALTEMGKKFNSVDFSKQIFDDLQQYKSLILIIAGAYGFHPSVLAKVNAQLSLSPLTFPHKFARIILIEQLYRAMTIDSGHPYHN
jgi:23S rRNA (pseudouridine1915-N3)-methyltransferase